MPKNFERDYPHQIDDQRSINVNVQGHTLEDGSRAVVITDQSTNPGYDLANARTEIAQFAEKQGFDLNETRFYEQDWHGNCQSYEMARQHQIESSNPDPSVNQGFGEFRVQDYQAEDPAVVDVVCDGQAPSFGQELQSHDLSQTTGPEVDRSMEQEIHQQELTQFDHEP